jgi:PKD repeat protein
VRFDFFRLGSGNVAPVISSITAGPNKGTAPLATQFDVTATDADGDTLTYAWDLDGNGTVDSTVRNPAFRYETAGTYTAKVTVSDGKLTAERTVTVTVEGAAVTQPVQIGSDVAPTLGLTLGPVTPFAGFVPGVDRDYTSTMTAAVVSTAGDAKLTVNDPGATKPGFMSNGAYSPSQPLQVRSGTGAFGGLPATLRTYSAPTGRDIVPVEFKQSITATDGLRSGRYSSTLVFTLSTTTP